MNSVPRKLTLGLGLALVAAACGDDVTVQEQPQPTPVVRSVVVSPSSATVAPGGSFTFGASVDADAGLARTVTWSSSNTTVANVDQSGVATASGTLTEGGVTSICAASTVDAGIKGCAQLTVSPAAAPATVQIGDITVGCTPLTAANPAFVACGQLSPVNINNVFGQIDIQTIISRPAGGLGGVTGVKLDIINATTGVVEATDTRTLSGDFVNGEETLALQSGLENTVTFQFETAHYDLSGPGGTAKVFHPNGPKLVRVSLIGGTAASTAERQLFFRNANGFHVTITTNLNSGNNENGVPISLIAGAGAPGGPGLVWKGGTDLAIQAIPVSYTGVALAATGNTVNFGLPGCDVTLGPRGVVATLAGGILAGTINYTNGSGAAGGDLDGYQTSGACAPAGEVPFATGVDATNNPFINIPLGIGFPNNTLNGIANPVNAALSTVPAIRLDNLGPAAATIAGNMNGRAFGWFNGAVRLNERLTGGNPDGTITNNPADAGPVGTVTFTAHGGACGSAATCGALAARTRVTDAPAIDESATGASYNLVVRTYDVFGTFTPSNVLPFGVDVTNPSVNVTLGAINNQIIQNVSLAYQQGATLFADVNAAASTYTAIDATTTVGAIPSGIAGPNNIRVINSRLDGASHQFWCPPNAQFQPSAGACPGATGWATGTQRFVQGAGIVSADPTAASPSVDGYFSITVDAVDNAGNVSTAQTRTVINDVTAAPAAFAPAFLPSVIPTNGAVTLNGSLTDNLEGARAAFAVEYPALVAGAVAIRQPWTVATPGAGVGGLTPTGFNFDPAVARKLSYNFSQNATVARSIEQATAGHAIDGTALNGAVAINAWQFQTWDVARNSSALVNPVIGLGSTGLVGTDPAAWAAASGATMGTIPIPADLTWQMCGSGAPVFGPGDSCPAFTGDIDVSGNASGGNVNTRTLRAVLNSAGTNPFQPSFLGGVKFYVVDNFQNAAFGNPLGSALVEACTAGPPVNNQADNTWIYSCNYTPSTLRAAHDLFGFDETLAAAQLALVSLGGADNVAVPVIAVGFNTAGNGLATQPLAFTHDR